MERSFLASRGIFKLKFKWGIENDANFTRVQRHCKLKKNEGEPQVPVGLQKVGLLSAVHAAPEHRFLRILEDRRKRRRRRRRRRIWGGGRRRRSCMCSRVHIHEVMRPRASDGRVSLQGQYSLLLDVDHKPIRLALGETAVRLSDATRRRAVSAQDECPSAAENEHHRQPYPQRDTYKYYGRVSPQGQYSANNFTPADAPRNVMMKLLMMIPVVRRLWWHQTPAAEKNRLMVAQQLHCVVAQTNRLRRRAVSAQDECPSVAKNKLHRQPYPQRDTSK
ncbi:unnamed protein product [Prorocentrum cordatum]|uniref:Uncharacterized protein n=1 Tax=Prorocentrum cordatum TaxID=2364126 RepID=A0ABN9V3Q3_9DINO|nr:unnamed protein product [Polarella glacialis]